MFLERRATRNDARAIAEVHVSGWRESYGSLVPERQLAALNVDEHADSWRDTLRASEREASIFVAISDDGALSGFVSGGPMREPAIRSQGFEGEVYALYIRKARQRRGAGKSLMKALASDLVQHGARSGAVCVFEENPSARAFYRKLGGEPTGFASDLNWLGACLPYLAYGWRDLRLVIDDAKPI